MSSRREAIARVASEIVSLAVPAVGIPIVVLSVGYLSNWMHQFFYGVPLGGVVSVDNIQTLEPLVTIGLLVTLIIASTEAITACWKLARAHTFEVFCRAI